MYNYIISYNLFKDKKLVASGDAFIECPYKILKPVDYESIKKKLEETCKERVKEFNYVQILSLNYLGKVE